MSSNVRANLGPPPDKQPDVKPGEQAYALASGFSDDFFWFQDPSRKQPSPDVSLRDLRVMTQRDGHARAMMSVLSLPIRAARRVVDPFEGGEAEAAFIRDMLELPPHRGGMSTPLSYVLAAHATAFRDGFRVFEKVVEVRQDEAGRFVHVLRKLKPLPTDTITFKYDDFGGFAGVVQEVMWNGQPRRIEMPPEKVLVFTVGKEEHPFRGEPLFLPAYYHYDKKHRLYHIAHVAANASAVEPRVVTAGPGALESQRQAVLKAVTQVGLASAAVVPAGWQVDTLSGGGQLASIVALIEHHDVSMSKSILAHFLDVGTEGKGKLGTATTTSELGDLFVVALEAHMQDIAAGINAYVIPYFVDANFGSGKYPTFKFEPFTDAQQVLLRETFNTVFSSEKPVARVLFEVQKHMSDQLGLEGIDWAKEKELFDEEEERARELRMIGQERSIIGMEAMRSSGNDAVMNAQGVGDGGSAPPIPPKQ